ncbi:MAG: MerR family transcriptional regulator [Vulcanimicrobiota bacterium]
MSEMRIGELAEATGLSVRALRHYERVGLLRPGGRSRAGHRLYGREQMEQLLRICALKNLGLSLAQVGGALGCQPLTELMEGQLARVEEELARLKALQQRLRRLAAYLDGPVPQERLLDLIQGVVQMEKYFTPEQLEQLRERRERSGSQEPKWRELGQALRKCMQAGWPPSHPEVRALAERRRQYILEFAGGDKQILATLRALREQPLPPKEALAGWDADLMEYANRALEV